MTDYVTLMGAEQVQSAGNRMSAAATEMLRAASSMEDSLFRHQRFLDDWLQRFADIMETAADRGPDVGGHS